MKTLLLILLTMLPCAADIPVTYADIVSLYGPSDSASDARAIAPGKGHGDHFTYNDIDVTLGSPSDPIRLIRYVRPTPFSELEIGSILQSLSPSEAWVEQPDGKTWKLPNAGARAVWDGEGHLTVTAK